MTAPAGPTGGPRGGTWRAPRGGVRHLPDTPRALVVGALAAVFALGAAPAAAQMAGVPTAPRVRRADTTAAVAEASPDSATRAARTSAQSAEQERQRLDIQAWVDSAAGALARSAPPGVPAPGAGGRASIFSEPAVPDSLRPPAAPAAAPRRAARPRRARP